MKKICNFIFCVALVSGVSPVFAATDNLPELILPKLPASTTSVGTLSLVLSVVPAYETSTGTQMLPSIEASELQSYSYSSRCSSGGRYASWYKCTRNGTFSKSENYSPFKFGDAVNLVATFYNYKSSLTLTSAPVNPYTGFTSASYTVTLEDHVTHHVVPPHSVTSKGTTYNGLDATGTVQYDLVFETPAFKAQGVSILLK